MCILGVKKWNNRKRSTNNHRLNALCAWVTVNRNMFVLYNMCPTIRLWKSTWLCRWGRSYVVRCCLSPRRFWVYRTIAPSVPMSFSWPSLRYPQLSSAFPNLSSLPTFYSHCSRFSCVVGDTVLWVDKSFNQSNNVWHTNNPRFNVFTVRFFIVLLKWLLCLT